MAAFDSKRPKTLTDLPPELCSAITGELLTASSIASLGRASKSLHAFVEKEGWKTFARNRFPTLCPSSTPSYKDTTRTLTTLSKAWDKRAFVARYAEPRGDITSYPGGNKVDKWKRPRGQTIGFTPQLDVYEEVGSTWQERDETVAFSAGAEICIRHTQRSLGRESIRWMTYRPHSAGEGKDDVTTLHLVRPGRVRQGSQVNILTGTANGDLQLIRFAKDDNVELQGGVHITHFTTQGLSVRSSSLYQESDRATLLAANLGDVRVALYHVDADKSKIRPLSQIDVQPFLRADGNPAPHHRAWSTTFLSSSHLAVGVGPSENPLHIYQITESGLAQAPMRKFGLMNDLNSLEGFKKRMSSAVYTTVPLPSSAGSRGDGCVFLSGAYDGVVRLHDMRSSHDVEQAYIDPADDSAIYSVLPRSREKFMAGTSRHNLVKVFDMRLGAKCYTYVSTKESGDFQELSQTDNDYNIFLRPNNQSFTARGGNWSQGRSRSAESSVYSLASPSPCSPFVYAGVENAIYSLAFTEILDPYPDPVYFEPWSAKAESQANPPSQLIQSRDVLGLAMYDQGANMKLCVQRSLWETWRACAQQRRDMQMRLDERWKGANEFGP